MTEKKTEFSTEVGCVLAGWSLLQIIIISLMNGGLWYLLLTHVEATPAMWILFCVWVPSQAVMSAVTTIIGWMHKMAVAEERRSA